MIKSFATFGIIALLAASMVALLGFAPSVEASEVAVLAKADQSPIVSSSADCSRQVWPNFSTSCLQNTGSTQKIVEARLVTARR